MTRGIVPSVLLLAVFIWIPQFSYGQEADLTPRFDVDQQYRFRVESDSVVTRSVPDLDQEISQTTKLTYFLTRTISVSDEDRIESQLRFDRILFSTQAPNLLGEMEDVVYDTGLRDPETGELQGRAVLGRGEFVAQQYAEILDPLLGQAIRITLDRAGAIQAVKIPEEFGDAEIFSVDMIRDRFLPLFQVHPSGGAVALGTEWELSSEQDSGLGFDVVSVTQWTLDSIEQTLGRISIRNTFSTGEVRRDTGITLQESSGSGEVVWDTQLGVLESLTSVQAIRMAGTPRELGGGRVELRVRSRLEIHRSSEEWALEAMPISDENSDGPEPDTD